MSGSAPVFLHRRLGLPDQDDESQDDTDSTLPSNCQIDGMSSLVALTLEHRLPLLGDGFISNASAITVRIGSGSFGTVSVSRLSVDLVGKRYSWAGEEDLFFPSDRPAGRKLAIKSIAIQPERDESIAAWASIAKEIRILGHRTLRKHQNIVDVITLGWTGTLYDDPKVNYRWPVLLMKHADCGTLEDFFTLDSVDFSWQLKIDLSYDII